MLHRNGDLRVPGGRTLTINFIGSACDAAWGAYRYAGCTVVAGSQEQPFAGSGACPVVGIPRTARVTLARPLGTRVVLDVASGLPLVPGFQPQRTSRPS